MSDCKSVLLVLSTAVTRNSGEDKIIRCLRSVLSYLLAGIVVVSNLQAEDTACAPETISAAIEKAIPLLEKGTAGSANQRKCFTCHNQALPVLALVEARQRGFSIDNDNLQKQLQHTVEHLNRGRKDYLEGRGQGGKVLTAGYALWSLDAGGWKSDDTTAAVTEFLTGYQKESIHWKNTGNRPPSSGGDFTNTYVALRGLAAFGTESQKSEIDARTESVIKWLLTESPRDTEDRVFRLRAFTHIDADKGTVQKAIAELVEGQRNNGGWAQRADMKSDAYATGTVLVALRRIGELSSDHPAVKRGVQYLVETQLDDGSWHVVSRAKPFQKYFESGFPHGKDQFISIAASSWTTMALLLTLSESP